MNHKKDTLPVNERIRAPRVQLIAHDGENRGVVSRDEALRLADEVGLDLVMIALKGGDGLPVVKVMDLGKALYEKKKKQVEAKKNQKIIQIKEIKVRPKIGGNDFQTKMKQAVHFLKDGKRVKMTLWFRGRENALKDKIGPELFDRIEQYLNEQNLSGLVGEKDSKVGQTWSRFYYIKGK